VQVVIAPANPIVPVLHGLHHLTYEYRDEQAALVMSPFHRGAPRTVG
jgi:hypothetical protein